MGWKPVRAETVYRLRLQQPRFPSGKSPAVMASESFERMYLAAASPGLSDRKHRTGHKSKCRGKRTAPQASLFKILCKCLFSEVTVQAVTELDNKAAHCHSPVLQRHRPFLGRRLDCQPHHFFHRVVCREHFTLFDRMADHAV